VLIREICIKDKTRPDKDQLTTRTINKKLANKPLRLKLADRNIFLVAVLDVAQFIKYNKLIINT